MPIHRKILTSLFICVLVAGQLEALIRDRERWPFSPYPMYSNTSREATYSEVRAIGIAEDGREVALFASTHLTPLLDSRVRTSVPAVIARFGEDSPEAKALLQGLFDLYELRRPHHGGPPLRALHFYRYSWRLDPRGDAIVEQTDREPLAAYRHED